MVVKPGKKSYNTFIYMFPQNERRFSLEAFTEIFVPSVMLAAFCMIEPKEDV